MIRIEPRLQVDISADIGQDSIAAFDVDQSAALYFLCTRKPDGHGMAPSGVSSPEIAGAEPRDYRLLCLREGRVAQDFTLAAVPLHCNHIQPLHDDFLLVSSRSRYRGPQDFDLNAQVFNTRGRRLRAFLLGDGIHDMQVTPSGAIWTSYFDEGILGNLGWTAPVGRAGLVCWSASGRKTYEFTPPSDLGPVADCYALNVESDAATWCYYYMDYSLVRIRNSVADAHWPVPVSGSAAFAVQGQYVLFIGDGATSDTDRFTLYAMNEGQPLRMLAELRAPTCFGGRFDNLVGRGEGIWFQRGPRVYRVSVSDALAAAGMKV